MTHLGSNGVPLQTQRSLAVQLAREMVAFACKGAEEEGQDWPS